MNDSLDAASDYGPGTPSTHVEPLTAVLEGPAPCDNCLAANHCGRHRLACEAFTAYVDGAREWRGIERQPTRERWDKLFEPEALKASAAFLRQGRGDRP